MLGGCNVCSDESGWTENPLVYCEGEGCNVVVHQACYGIVAVLNGSWFCRKCESQERAARVRCELCPSKDGALKRTDKNGWAHVLCALYIPEVQFGNNTTMEPIILPLMPPECFNRSCYICKEDGKLTNSTVGACIQCNKPGCKQQFHVTCAQAVGLLCEEAGNYMDNVKYCGYCPQHYSERVVQKAVGANILMSRLQSGKQEEKPQPKPVSPPEIPEPKEPVAAPSSTVTITEIERQLLVGQPPGTVIKCVTAQVLQGADGPRIVLQGIQNGDFTQQQLALVQQQVKQKLLRVPAGKVMSFNPTKIYLAVQPKKYKKYISPVESQEAATAAASPRKVGPSVARQLFESQVAEQTRQGTGRREEARIGDAAISGLDDVRESRLAEPLPEPEFLNDYAATNQATSSQTAPPAKKRRSSMSDLPADRHVGSSARQEREEALLAQMEETGRHLERMEGALSRMADSNERILSRMADSNERILSRMADSNERILSRIVDSNELLTAAIVAFLNRV